MDLVASADNIIVAMMHTNKAGESKLLEQCSLPLNRRQLCEKGSNESCRFGNPS